MPSINKNRFLTWFIFSCLIALVFFSRFLISIPLSFFAKRFAISMQNAQCTFQSRPQESMFNHMKYVFQNKVSFSFNKHYISFEHLLNFYLIWTIGWNLFPLRNYIVTSQSIRLGLMMKCPIMSSWALGEDNLPTLLALTSSFSADTFLSLYYQKVLLNPFQIVCFNSNV